MSRPRRPGGDDPPAISLNAPFRDLKKLVGELPTQRPAPEPRRTAPTPAVEPEDDAALFRRAVDGAVPLPPGSAVRIELPPVPAPRPGAREDAEALAVLSDLVSGNGRFDVSDTDEHLEGAVNGLDSRLVRKLRAGEFAQQAHLDLHGMTAEEAKLAARQFLLRALRAGHRCVLLIHGRGHNSPDRRSVLKESLKGWLTRGELSQIVLAFSTARACDGGAGATYVLLRRQRRPKRPFTTYEGAKR